MHTHYIMQLIRLYMHNQKYIIIDVRTQNFFLSIKIHDIYDFLISRQATIPVCCVLPEVWERAHNQDDHDSGSTG